jgi:hypothetical protein
MGVRHDITEILLKVALNTINLTPNPVNRMHRYISETMVLRIPLYQCTCILLLFDAIQLQQI